MVWRTVETRIQPHVNLAPSRSVDVLHEAAKDEAQTWTGKQHHQGDDRGKHAEKRGADLPEDVCYQESQHSQTADGERQTQCASTKWQATCAPEPLHSAHGDPELVQLGNQGPTDSGQPKARPNCQ